ncbi:MAG: prolyl oligopeptidase family serine peptidase [Archangium sp.]|nr:prolyl oligopeptidase family serine peptidase [Archangium sp.]
MTRIMLVWVALLACSASAESSVQKARKGFKTKLVTRLVDSEPLPPLPPKLFEIVQYQGPLGPLQAMVSKAPGPGKHPAILWLSGGFPPGGMNEAAWEPQPRGNDQSGAQFRTAGLVVMYPTLRGSFGNAGQAEAFLGEVDDVLAALTWLRASPDVDSTRIYLGGHSTGATLALLVAASTDVRGVLALGPIDDVCAYGQQSLPFDVRNKRECAVRSPLQFLDAVRAPTLVIEGQLGNSEALHAMERATKNPKLSFLVLEGFTHFSAIAPVNEFFAPRLARATVDAPLFDVAALREAVLRPRVVTHPDGWALSVPPGFEEKLDAEDAKMPFTFVRYPSTLDLQVIGVQRLGGTIGRECASAKGLEKMNAKPLSTKWGTFELCGFRQEKQKGEATLVVLSFEVPTAKSAIIVHVTGFLENEVNLLALAQQTVASVKGQSSWK